MKSDTRIQERFSKDTKIIVDTLLGSLTLKPIAILLYGGYGRGEGAWFEDNNGNIIPYNDYDIDVVTEEIISNNLKQELRKLLAIKIGIRWIDLGFISPETIKGYKSTIQNIDLKEASTLLYGDKSVYDLFPQMDKNKIGKFDVEKLYKTRIWTFLGSWSGNFHDLDVEESRFFKNQMAKAILASCDLLLIAKKRYVTSYKQRVEIVNKLYPSIISLQTLSNWAIKEKLNPSSESITLEEMINLYTDVRSLFCFSMSIAYKFRWFFLKTPSLTKLKMFYFTIEYPKTIIHKLLGQNCKNEKIVDILCAQNFTFWAWNNDTKSLNISYIKRASDILIKWNYIDSPISDWNELRIAVSNARNNI